jgi:putative acetyltransferase
MMPGRGCYVLTATEHKPNGVKNMTITIRSEYLADADAIFEVTRLAFLAAPHTNHKEQFIVNALRRTGHLALSLVAVEEHRLVGHVAFSPVAVSTGDTGWYGLGPLSVLPERQRKGIGSLLVQQGMEMLRGRNAQGCVLLGDPAYYSRLGFTPCKDLILPNVPPKYFLCRSFGAFTPKGEVTFSPAFEATA